MGEVYLALDETLDRHVAIKALSTSAIKDENTLKCFHQEAKSVAKISHKNIIEIYSVGELDGQQFIVMEYMKGAPLSKSLMETNLGLHELLVIMNQILEGVSAAHSNQILHRDLKPANIVVDSQLNVKILDFGVSKDIGSCDENNSTQTGEVWGTVDYFSPEILKGMSHSIQTDIFSLGVIFYELVWGEKPFKGKNNWEVMEAIRSLPPSRSSLIPKHIPETLLNVISKMLEKDPLFRYQNISEVLDDIQKIETPPQYRSTSIISLTSALVKKLPHPFSLPKIVWIGFAVGLAFLGSLYSFYKTVWLSPKKTIYIQQKIADKVSNKGLSPERFLQIPDPVANLEGFFAFIASETFGATVIDLPNDTPFNSSIHRQIESGTIYNFQWDNYTSKNLKHLISTKRDHVYKHDNKGDIILEIPQSGLTLKTSENLFLYPREFTNYKYYGNGTSTFSSDTSDFFPLKVGKKFSVKASIQGSFESDTKSVFCHCQKKVQITLKNGIGPINAFKVYCMYDQEISISYFSPDLGVAVLKIDTRSASKGITVQVRQIIQFPQKYLSTAKNIADFIRKPTSQNSKGSRTN
ncbi:MAG: serine/threonine protein kinase [Bdellovibrionales bacterium]|nr:serine/threonine protein kinase [Bdellovibrionales bacterium]